jgi:hypothetical protein
MSLDLVVNTLRTVSRLSPKRQSLAQEKRCLVLSLRAVGFDQVGGGSFGLVLAQDKMAVKIVNSKESTGYLAYARMCRASHTKNRLFPKVYAVLTCGRYSFVIMEKLHVRSQKSAPFCHPLRRASRKRLMPGRQGD